MRIPAAMEPFNAEFRKVKSLEKQSRPAERSNSLSIDTSDLSSDAHRLSSVKSQAESAAAHALQSPEIRQDKVNLAIKRVKEGYYDRPEIQDKLAEKMIGDLGITGLE
ncbi:MAG: hypothetical protein GF350_16785 [Chitinivibrionales bacterium]|nr:hypothetical protein [Chitinivibrionales bacterium]